MMNRTESFRAEATQPSGTGGTPVSPCLSTSSSLLWHFISRAAVTLCATIIILPLAGCPKEEAPVAAPVVSAPPPPPDPWEGITLAAKVEFPKEKGPSDGNLLRATVDLANALAKGDEAAMMPLLSRRDQSVLKDLAERGEWKTQTANLELVRVCALNVEDGKAKLGLGVQDKAGAYLLAFEGENAGGSWTFSGLAIEPKTARAAADLDGVELNIRPISVAAAAAAPVPPAPKPEDAQPEESSSSSPSSGSPGRVD